MNCRMHWSSNLPARSRLVRQSRSSLLMPLRWSRWTQNGVTSCLRKIRSIRLDQKNGSISGSMRSRRASSRTMHGNSFITKGSDVRWCRRLSKASTSFRETEMITSEVHYPGRSTSGNQRHSAMDALATFAVLNPGYGKAGRRQLPSPAHPLARDQATKCRRATFGLNTDFRLRPHQTRKSRADCSRAAFSLAWAGLTGQSRP